LESGIPNTALDDVWTNLPTPASRAATRRFAVPRTLTDLRDVVQDHVDPVARGAHGGAVADVAGDVFDRFLTGGRRVDVEDPHLVAARHGAADEDLPEVSAAPGHEDGPRH
jgi:hypothetical protein